MMNEATDGGGARTPPRARAPTAHATAMDTPEGRHVGGGRVRESAAAPMDGRLLGWSGGRADEAAGEPMPRLGAAPQASRGMRLALQGTGGWAGGCPPVEQASGEGQGLACPPVERMGGAGWGGGDLAASLALLAAPMPSYEVLAAARRNECWASTPSGPSVAAWLASPEDVRRRHWRCPNCRSMVERALERCGTCSARYADLAPHALTAEIEAVDAEAAMTSYGRRLKFAEGRTQMEGEGVGALPGTDGYVGAVLERQRNMFAVRRGDLLEQRPAYGVVALDGWLALQTAELRTPARFWQYPHTPPRSPDLGEWGGFPLNLGGFSLKDTRIFSVSERI